MNAQEKVKEYIESLGMENGIDPSYILKLAEELDQTRNQLVRARAALYRIGVEVDMIIN